MSMKTTLGSIVASMLVAMSTNAQQIDFDLYGVRVGDALPAVDVALEEAGYERTSIRHGPSFEQAVALRRRQIEQQDAVDAPLEARYARDEDEVLVEFTPWPNGPAVTRVIYRPDLVVPDDCPALLEAFEARYSHGIAYAGNWIDRPLVKDGIERPSLDAVTAKAKCRPMSSVMILLSQTRSNFALRDLLDQADGEKTHDF